MHTFAVSWLQTIFTLEHQLGSFTFIQLNVILWSGKLCHSLSYIHWWNSYVPEKSVLSCMIYCCGWTCQGITTQTVWSNQVPKPIKTVMMKLLPYGKLCFGTPWNAERHFSHTRSICVYLSDIRKQGRKFSILIYHKWYFSSDQWLVL